jgi:hypothetical protein
VDIVYANILVDGVFHARYIRNAYCTSLTPIVHLS